DHREEADYEHGAEQARGQLTRGNIEMACPDGAIQCLPTNLWGDGGRKQRRELRNLLPVAPQPWNGQALEVEPKGLVLTNKQLDRARQAALDVIAGLRQKDLERDVAHHVVRL